MFFDLYLLVASTLTIPIVFVVVCLRKTLNRNFVSSVVFVSSRAIFEIFKVTWDFLKFIFRKMRRKNFGIVKIGLEVFWRILAFFLLFNVAKNLSF